MTCLEGYLCYELIEPLWLVNVGYMRRYRARCFRHYLHTPMRRRHRLGLDLTRVSSRRVKWFKGRRYVIQWELPW